MTLTKLDIIESVYEQSSIPKKHCTRIVENLFEIIKDDLSAGNDLMISGFGKWSVRRKKERNGRNPKTGEQITLDERRIVTFRSSPLLKNAINSED